MGGKGAIAGLTLALVLMGQQSLALAGCPCPKQSMIDMYGTVSIYGPKTSPHLPPPVMTASDLAIRHVARGLPVQLPLRTPASDQVAASFRQALASVE